MSGEDDFLEAQYEDANGGEVDTAEEGYDDEDATICKWYALCDNETESALPHPILGLVPTCGRCAAKHGMEHALVPIADI